MRSKGAEGGASGAEEGERREEEEREPHPLGHTRQLSLSVRTAAYCTPRSPCAACTTSRAPQEAVALALFSRLADLICRPGDSAATSCVAQQHDKLARRGARDHPVPAGVGACALDRGRRAAAGTDTRQRRSKHPQLVPQARAALDVLPGRRGGSRRLPTARLEPSSLSYGSPCGAELFSRRRRPHITCSLSLTVVVSVRPCSIDPRRATSGSVAPPLSCFPSPHSPSPSPSPLPPRPPSLPASTSSHSSHRHEALSRPPLGPHRPRRRRATRRQCAQAQRCVSSLVLVSHTFSLGSTDVLTRAQVPSSSVRSSAAATTAVCATVRLSSPLSLARPRPS